jgi:hypothetical protein
MPKKRERAKRDTHPFTETEEAFFREGEREHEPVAAESFDDLDEGYEPSSFLKRLLSKLP